MKAKIWTLVFTVILFAAVSGCGKTAAQETEITQQASLESRKFCEEQAPRRRNPSSKPVQLPCRFFTATDPYPYYLDDGAPLLAFWADAKETDCALALLSKTRRCALVSGTGRRRRRYFLCKISAAGANRRRQRYCVRLRAPSGAGVESDAEREFLLPPLSRRRQALRRLPAYPDKCAGQSTFRCTRTLRASD